MLMLTALRICRSAMDMLMMMVFILTLVSAQMILGIIDHSREQGMKMLIGQLENKAIITKG